MAVEKEKVLRGLKACSLGDCSICPYHEIRCTEHLCGDAYHLLAREDQMDEIYNEPKYKPGDVVIFKWPLFKDEPDDPEFEYRYYVILAADSKGYRMLRLKTGIGVPDTICYVLAGVVNTIFDAKVLYHIDAETIIKLCCEGPQI